MATYISRTQADKNRETAQARMDTVLADLTAALEDAGYVVTRNDDLLDPRLFVKDHSNTVSTVASLSLAYSGEKFSRRPTGKLRLTVGGVIDGKKNYPEPKNGFDLKKTVERIGEKLDAVKAAEAHRVAKHNREQERRATVARLNAEHGLDGTYTGKGARVVANKYGNLTVELGTLTEDQIRTVLNTLALNCPEALVARR